MTHHHHETSDGVDAEAFWDQRYRESPHFHDRPNPVLVEVATELTPGTALDLGCGYGSDAVWLATLGWTVTGADVSGTALAHALEAATRADVTDRTRWERHDLGQTFPEGSFDLVTTHYLHSPAELPREAVLRRAAAVVAPGGTLVVVGHAKPTPWSSHPDTDMPGPDDVWSSLELPATGWRRVRVGLAERPVTSPDGEQTTMTDSVVVARRTADERAARGH